MASRAGKLRDIVAQCFAEAAGLHEIALHVDDQQRRGRQSRSIGAGSAATVPMDVCVEFAMT
jgi:hypothetical protein